MLASLRETFPGIDWEQQAAYFFQRVIEHGRRRAEEMREAAAPCARPASSHGARRARPSARPGSPTSRDEGLFGEKRRQAVRPQRRLARRGRPDPRSSSRTPTEELTPCRLREDPRLARLVRRARASRGSAAAGRGRRALPRVRPGRRIPLRARAQVHAVRREQGRSCSRCAITSASRATSSCRRPATAPTTARWSTPCRASGGKARGVATVRRDVTDRELSDLHEAGVRGVRFNFVKRLVDFTPRDELVGDRRRASRRSAGTSSIYFEARRPAASCGTSSPRCRRPSSSTTWAGPTSRSRSTAPSSSCSSNLMREHDERLDARSAAPSACRSPVRRR